MDTEKLITRWIHQMFILLERSTNEEYKTGVRDGIRYCYRSLRIAMRPNKRIQPT